MGKETKIIKLPHFQQKDNWSCAIKSSLMIYAYWKNIHPDQSLEKDFLLKSGFQKNMALNYGNDMNALILAFQKLGMKAQFKRINLLQLKAYLNRDIPVMGLYKISEADFRQNRFARLYSSAKQMYRQTALSLLHQNK